MSLFVTATVFEVLQNNIVRVTCDTGEGDYYVKVPFYLLQDRVITTGTVLSIKRVFQDQYAELLGVLS